MIRRREFQAALAAAVLAPGPARAQPIELAGVRYEPQVTVAGTRLLLNGAGIRYKALFKVYTAGLYLTARASTAEAVQAMPGPKRVHVSMLRDIDANELGKLFTRGMEQNSTREEFVRAIAGTMRMSEVFFVKKRLLAGETFSVDWMPGSGTVVRVNGQAQNDPVVEPEFYNALLRIWLGHSPADSLLKDALLGVAAPRNELIR